MNRIIFSNLDDYIIVMFEYKQPLTGGDNARICIKTKSSMENLRIGIPLPVQFDSQWTLTFDEAIKYYHKGDDIGTYEFEGKLLDGNKCNFLFNTNLFPGQWKIDFGTLGKNENYSKLFKRSRNVLRITKIK
jgi:hypothetical protein